MVSRRLITSQTASSTARHSLDLGTTQASEASYDVAVKRDTRKPSDIYQEQSATRVTLLLTSVLMSMFLVALDRTIISTVWVHYNKQSSRACEFIVALRDRVLTGSDQAIPKITDEFNSLPDVGWYGSAYLLTCCSFQLLLGKLYTFYAVKVVLLTNILLFEVGSIICGTAPSSTAFIVGRAIAGVGAAGIFAGAVS